MLFYFESTPALFAFLARLFTPAPSGVGAVHLLLAYLPLLCLAVLAATPLPGRLARRALARPALRWLRVAAPALLMLLCLAALATQSYNPFIYFRF